MAPLFAGSSDDRSRGRRRTDLILGIALGVAIGLGVLVYFVFGHSEGTIDAPKVNGGDVAGKTVPTPRASPRHGHRGAAGRPAGKGRAGRSARRRPVPVVTVIGGAPPTAGGPKRLTFRKGQKVRFEIETDEPFSFEIRGLGIKQSIERSSIISFRANRAGQFPVIATATLIGVADLLIEPPR